MDFAVRLVDPILHLSRWASEVFLEVNLRKFTYWYLQKDCKRSNYCLIYFFNSSIVLGGEFFFRLVKMTVGLLHK